MYQKSFYITDPISNNAFSFDERKNPRIFVPKIIDGNLDDVKVGTEPVFEDFDEHGQLQTCKGLEYFVRTHHPQTGKPVYIFDNNNHSFYFWFEAESKGWIERGATVFHLDGHRDTRKPQEPLTSDDLEHVFDYTNRVLNVGNYFPPALENGIISRVISVISEKEMDENPPHNIPNLIANIDLDFWAKELDYIDWKKKINYARAWCQKADLMTICTSPFFINQKRALKALHEIFD